MRLLQISGWNMRRALLVTPMGNDLRDVKEEEATVLAAGLDTLVPCLPPSWPLFTLAIAAAMRFTQK